MNLHIKCLYSTLNVFIFFCLFEDWGNGLKRFSAFSLCDYVLFQNEWIQKYKPLSCVSTFVQYVRTLNLHSKPSITLLLKLICLMKFKIQPICFTSGAQQPHVTSSSYNGYTTLTTFQIILWGLTALDVQMNIEWSSLTAHFSDSSFLIIIADYRQMILIAHLLEKSDSLQQRKLTRKWFIEIIFPIIFYLCYTNTVITLLQNMWSLNVS